MCVILFHSGPVISKTCSTSNNFFVKGVNKEGHLHGLRVFYSI